MPRRTNSEMRADGKHSKRYKKGPRVEPIDWDRIGKPVSRSFAGPKRPKSKPEDTFKRNLDGFNTYTLEVMAKFGLENVDEKGFLPITFTGRSQKPRRTTEYKNLPCLQQRLD